MEKPRLRVALEHEIRDIEVPFTVTGPLGRSVRGEAQLSADSTGVTVRVQPAERWQLYFAAVEHDDERDLALLPRIERLNFLSASTLTLTNSFTTTSASSASSARSAAAY
jgi:hypothetical protein